MKRHFEDKQKLPSLKQSTLSFGATICRAKKEIICDNKQIYKDVEDAEKTPTIIEKPADSTTPSNSVRLGLVQKLEIGDDFLKLSVINSSYVVFGAVEPLVREFSIRNKFGSFGEYATTLKLLGDHIGFEIKKRAQVCTSCTRLRCQIKEYNVFQPQCACDIDVRRDSGTRRGRDLYLGLRVEFRKSCSQPFQILPAELPFQKRAKQKKVVYEKEPILSGNINSDLFTCEATPVASPVFLSPKKPLIPNDLTNNLATAPQPPNLEMFDCNALCNKIKVVTVAEMCAKLDNKNSSHQPHIYAHTTDMTHVKLALQQTLALNTRRKCLILRKPDGGSVTTPRICNYDHVTEMEFPDAIRACFGVHMSCSIAHILNFSNDVDITWKDIDLLVIYGNRTLIQQHYLQFVQRLLKVNPSAQLLVVENCEGNIGFSNLNALDKISTSHRLWIDVSSISVTNLLQHINCEKLLQSLSVKLLNVPTKVDLTKAQLCQTLLSKCPQPYEVMFGTLLPLMYQHRNKYSFYFKCTELKKRMWIDNSHAQQFKRDFDGFKFQEQLTSKQIAFMWLCIFEEQHESQTIHLHFLTSIRTVDEDWFTPMVKFAHLQFDELKLMNQECHVFDHGLYGTMDGVSGDNQQVIELKFPSDINFKAIDQLQVLLYNSMFCKHTKSRPRPCVLYNYRSGMMLQLELQTSYAELRSALIRFSL